MAVMYDAGEVLPDPDSRASEGKEATNTLLTAAGVLDRSVLTRAPHPAVVAICSLLHAIILLAFQRVSHLVIACCRSASESEIRRCRRKTFRCGTWIASGCICTRKVYTTVGLTGRSLTGREGRHGCATYPLGPYSRRFEIFREVCALVAHGVTRLLVVRFGNAGWCK